MRPGERILLLKTNAVISEVSRVLCFWPKFEAPVYCSAAKYTVLTHLPQCEPPIFLFLRKVQRYPPPPIFLFSILYWVGKSELLFAFAVIADDLTAAFATVAFVAFISLLVDRTYTATQYALLASIGTAGRTMLASSSGTLVDWLNGNWGIFFILTSIMVLPSLLCLWYIREKIQISEK